MTSPVVRPAFLARFKCLGADCEDTCCKGWDMQVGASTCKRYNDRAPELLDSVNGEGAVAIMKRDANTDYCVKFEGGLCGIQAKYGEDFLGDACFFYPRVVRKVGGTTVMTAALSCPEIVRLALFDDNAFIPDTASADRLPEVLQDYLPETLTTSQALAVHRMFLDAMLDKTVTPERMLMRMFVVSESLARVSPATWPDAVPFYLENADSGLPAPESHDTDTVYLLQSLCGLVAAAKKIKHARLIETIDEMQQALHVTVPWDSLAIVSLPDSKLATRILQGRWKNEWQAHFTPLLRRYATAQLSLALFPFAGFGGTLTQRIAIIGIRFAILKLALMSACQKANGIAPDAQVVRVVQSLSRFLDHLAEPEFSLKIYQETGWLQKRRLRALLGDGL